MEIRSQLAWETFSSLGPHQSYGPVGDIADGPDGVADLVLRRVQHLVVCHQLHLVTEQCLAAQLRLDGHKVGIDLVRLACQVGDGQQLVEGADNLEDDDEEVQQVIHLTELRHGQLDGEVGVDRDLDTMVMVTIWTYWKKLQIPG